jgi:hypothetical protein
MRTTMGRRAARAIVSAAVVAALLGANAEAAVLANVEGAVSVNRGDGYRPAGGGAGLAPGDRVRTAAGSADIVYENGCSLRIGPDQTVAVLSSPPPCNGGSMKDSGGEPAALGVFGAPPLLLGGLVVGGAVGLTLVLTNNNNTPYSP